MIRVAAIVVGGFACVAVAGVLFAWSGLYSVAASKGHWPAVSWLLDFGMRSSVRTQAMGITVPRLEDQDLVRLGAGHFHGGCAYCHGAPGLPVNPIAGKMLPPPPPLKVVVNTWESNELFWIVKHGIKYTGMPAWAAPERDDEVWAVVAFLHELPRLDADGYRGLALDRVDIAQSSGRELAETESNPQAAGACARCHGAGETGPQSDLVPILHGQPVAFLTKALQAYADGARASGIMRPVASDLDAASITRVAEYYAGLAYPSGRGSPPPADAAAPDRGRALAIEGDPENGIPACNACHGNHALTTFPRLAGQHAAYTRRQLALWQRGLNATTDSALIMAPIAERLSAQQVRDAAAYYASLAVSRPVRESRQ